MAKELPYFKFIVADWLIGDIVYEKFNIQGLFINICAIYWQRNGTLSIEEINKRFKNPTELTELTDRFFSVNNGFISIDFLDEQFIERKKLSLTNSENGLKGGRPKVSKTLQIKPNANRTLTETKAKQSNIEKKRKEKNIKYKKISFENSDLFDKIKFADYFNGWSREKLSYYYSSALRYSKEGNVYSEWGLAISNWAKKDEIKGEIIFDKPNKNRTILTGTV